MDKQIYNDNQITDALSSAAPQPDAQWVANARQNLQVLAAQSPAPRRGFNLFIYFTAVNRTQIMRLAAVVGVVAIVGVGALGYIYTRNLTSVRSVSLSAEEQQQILAQVLTHNSSGAIASPQTATDQALSTKLAAGSSPRPMLSINPSYFPQGDYNYRYSTVVYRNGPASDKCQALNYGATNNQVTTYEYSDNQGASYYKNILLDSDGDLSSYSLSKSTTSGSEYWEYRGGQFAVKTVYTAPTPVAAPAIAPDDTTASPVAPDPGVSQPSIDDIKSYFGENAQIQSVASERGVEYYVIQYSFPIDCSQQIMLMKADDATTTQTASAPKNTAVYVSWVKKDDFSAYKSLTYLDTVSDETLIGSSVQTADAKKTDFAAVSNFFNFEFNVSVRTLDSAALSVTPEQQAQAAADYLSTLKMDVLVPAISDMPVTGIYANDPNPKQPAGWDYAQDRTYYPAGAKGDKMFSDATVVPNVAGTDYVPVVISVSANNSDYTKSLTVSGFAGERSDEQILKSQYGEYTAPAAQTVNWTLDGQSVTANVYTLTIKSSILPYMSRDLGTTSEGGSAASQVLIAPGEPNCPADGCTSTQKVAVVKVNGGKFAITVSDGVDIASLKFDVFSTANSTQLSALQAKMLELNIKMQVPGEVKPL